MLQTHNGFLRCQFKHCSGSLHGKFPRAFIRGFLQDYWSLAAKIYCRLFQLRRPLCARPCSFLSECSWLNFRILQVRCKILFFLLTFTKKTSSLKAIIYAFLFFKLQQHSQFSPSPSPLCNIERVNVCTLKVYSGHIMFL